MAQGELTGQLALVTGAGAGIGRASAIVLAREGARVAVVDIDHESAQRTASDIEAAGGTALALACDIADAEQVGQMVRTIVEEFDGLDCAHNNAGVEDPVGPTHELTEAGWDGVLAVDLRGTWLCIKHEVAHMLEHGGGSIVNTTSVLSSVAQRHAPAYTAAKHGLLGLTRAAALDYADRGIRVNAVSPGVIHTALVDRVVAAGAMTAEEFEALQPMGRVGQSEEVGEAVAWLLSDRASFVTGLDMAVDGGYLLR
jgi:NAD(P)-dependent dehydrogenase (short-subunit alcohol dehydrogenase family)